MRKLLLGTTALAAAGAIVTNSALADVSISAETEFRFASRSSEATAVDGNTYGTDSEIKFSFTNKTDSGLDIGYTVEMTSDGGDSTIDESSLSISGGFGKLVLGDNDGVGQDYGIGENDILAEENTIAINSSTISTSSDITSPASDSTKVSYHLPAMGGLTMGVSSYDSGYSGATDATEFGARYTQELAAGTVTLAYAAAEQDASIGTVETGNMAVKLVNGPLTFILAQGTYEANGEDRTNNGFGIGYDMGDGMKVSGYTFSSEDATDTNEQLDKQGVEVAYTIASGLTAYVTIENYEYDAGTSATTVDDEGVMSSLVINASF